jgi:hypothetical protein
VVRRNWSDATYMRWRYTVRKRDKCTCQFPNCGVKKNIKVHHIREWSKNPSLRFVVSNGICLCRAHHDSIRGKEVHYIALFTEIVSRKCIK